MRQQDPIHWPYNDSNNNKNKCVINNNELCEFCPKMISLLYHTNEIINNNHNPMTLSFLFKMLTVLVDRVIQAYIHQLVACCQQIETYHHETNKQIITTITISPMMLMRF